ncbi:hypothetical protein Moror_13004 [Moniliophthora roreri MCA 2997]|uniref:Uncharacterized protein n=2 Tax=Moniliophthora roreri TaxID=221103 RepID=V2XJI3_MONRO|nr:hypothetical protein Moror_13004 [Moniliophthora roreri MCA 2997]
MSSNSPRPILKRSPSNNQRSSAYCHAVHFPPSPSLTRTFECDSSALYDRSPIVVSPNSCALPERGCPGRTYTIDDQSAGPSGSKFNKMPSTPRNGHAHPRAFQSPNYAYTNAECSYSSSLSIPPPLVPDFSSESEESDGFISPPPESYQYSSFPYPSRHSRAPVPQYPQRNDKYPPYILYPDNSYTSQGPSPHINSSIPSSPGEIKVRRRRSSRERDRDHRIRGLPGHDDADDPGYEDDRDVPIPPSPSTPTKKSRSRKNVSSLTQSMSSFSMQDDGGCLGGF